MVLISEKALGEIAAEHPAAVRVLEKYGIDYCCGGDHSVEQACREKGIQAEQLLAEVEVAAPGVEKTDWTAAPLAALADHIVSRHHGYLRSELPALALMIDKVIVAHGQNHSDSLLPLRETFAGLKQELTSHMMKEEVILFPLIKRMEAAEKAGSGLPRAHCGSVNNPIRVMEYEHDNAAKALRDMRRITSDYALPPDACNTYRALFQRLMELVQDLHVHIHLENNILFPRASKVERRILTQEGGAYGRPAVG